MTDILQPDPPSNDAVPIIPAQPPAAPLPWYRRKLILLRSELPSPAELITLISIGGFVLLYGLVPIFGGDQLGLVGADEPRYAQVAREMLAVHATTCNQLHADMVPRTFHRRDIAASTSCLLAGTVTPILFGQPWLE